MVVEKRQVELVKLSENCKYNKIELNKDAKIGVITSGIAYQYAKEALGDSVSYLKLGMVNPLPKQLIKDFASQVDTLYVIEELDDIIEHHVKALGIDCIGKEIFTYLGEDVYKRQIPGSTSATAAIKPAIAKGSNAKMPPFS